MGKYIISVASVGAILFLLFSGYLIGLHELTSYGFFRRVELKLFDRYFEKRNEPPVTYYDSIFLRLYKTETDLRDYMTRHGSGGGLTSFGDAVVLLSYDGQIFSARSADDITKTDIQIPDYGFAAYLQAAESDQYKNLQHDIQLYRYNDILFYESEEQRGFAISYTEFDAAANCYRNTVATLPLALTIKSIEEVSASSEDWNIIYRSNPCLPLKNMRGALEGGVAGGRMVFRAPSTIFMGNGDYHWDGMYGPEVVAQDPFSDYGKVVSLDLATGENRILASGIRNPQGITLDRTGDLWIVEHGPRGGDELNRIEEDQNYGWPLESLGTQYSKFPIPNSTDETYGRHDNFEEPIYAWLPSVAVSSLARIEGFHPSWDGDFLIGSLKGRSLYRVRVKNDRVLFAEQIEVGERIRYVHQHTDGRIVLWTDLEHLVFLTGKPYNDNFVTDYLASSITDEELREKVGATIETCLQCHSIEYGDDANAPSLALVYGAEIASGNYENYSRALEEKRGTFWTPANLEKFLSNPEQFAPGTTMQATGIRDNTVIEEIIKFLEALNTRATE